MLSALVLSEDLIHTRRKFIKVKYSVVVFARQQRELMSNKLLCI